MITNQTEIATQVSNWQSQGLKVVLATGVFDLIHIEHIHFLNQAKNLGDKLIVGLETDDRVARMKGNHRPINPLSIRLEQIEAIKVVDLAFSLPDVFDQQTDWLAFMQKLKPDYYAVSSHSKYIENKRAICHQTQVQLQIVLPHNPNYSTTKLIHATPAAEEPRE